MLADIMKKPLRRVQFENAVSLWTMQAGNVLKYVIRGECRRNLWLVVLSYLFLSIRHMFGNF